MIQFLLYDLQEKFHSHFKNVQLFLLIRALQPDPGVKIKNQKYILGEDSDKRELTFTDNYRRTVFTTTIRLNNVGANLWRI